MATLAEFILLAAAASAGTPEASWFVGEWTCVRPATGLTFEWRVSDRQKGRWLVGEATMDDEAVALDVWAYEEGGALGLRRQFSMSNVIIEMNPSMAKPMTIDLEGVFDPSGKNIPMQESVRFKNQSEFSAQWRYFDSETNEWIVDSDETCIKKTAS